MDWTTIGRKFEPSLTYRALKQTTGAEDSEVRVEAEVSANENGSHTARPELTNLSSSDVRRWEVYADGKLVGSQPAAPVTWSGPEPEDVVLAAYTAEGSVWHSKPSAPATPPAEPPRAEAPATPPRIAPGVAPARRALIATRSPVIRARVIRGDAAGEEAGRAPLRGRAQGQRVRLQPPQRRHRPPDEEFEARPPHHPARHSQRQRAERECGVGVQGEALTKTFEAFSGGRRPPRASAPPPRARPRSTHTSARVPPSARSRDSTRGLP